MHSYVDRMTALNIKLHFKKSSKGAGITSGMHPKARNRQAAKPDDFPYRIESIKPNDSLALLSL